MKNKNSLRFLGVLGSLLIIIGVFLPFIKTTEFSISLWKTFIENKQIYLPIIIIIFGLIPMILYFMNKNMEYSYVSVGTLLFFMIVEILGTVFKLGFGAFTLGFYSILVGIILIFVTTTFLTKKEKVKAASKERENN